MEVELRVLFDLTEEAMPSVRANIEDSVSFLHRHTAHQIGVTNVRSYIYGLERTE